jgi:acyl-CoA thioester hydrolase
VTYERTLRVFVGDDDSSGLIYFAAYYKLISEGEQLMFAELGVDVAAQIRNGAAMPVVHSECDCVGPARAGDTLRHAIGLEVGARSTVTTHHLFRQASTNELTARGTVVRVLTDMETMASIPVPDGLRALLTPNALTPESLQSG